MKTLFYKCKIDTALTLPPSVTFACTLVPHLSLFLLQNFGLVSVACILSLSNGFIFRCTQFDLIRQIEIMSKTLCFKGHTFQGSKLCM